MIILPKFKKKESQEDLLPEELSEMIESAVDTPEKPKEPEKKDEDDEFNPNGMEMVVDRVEHGLVGSLMINNDNTNKPLFKNGDIVHFRSPSRLQKKDIVLYKNHDEYYIRRIIKFKEDDIYVAGDNEKAYHVIRKEEIIGKAIGRQRKKKFLSFSFTKNYKTKFYDFRKVNLAKFRLGNRILDYEQEVDNDVYENALLLSETTQAQQQVEKPKYIIDIDLDSDLADFLNPDDLVLELKREQQAVEQTGDEDEEEVVYEEVEEPEYDESEEDKEETLESEESDYESGKIHLVDEAEEIDI